MDAELTERERACLLWAARGKTGWEIAVILQITERTVKKHLGTAMRKLGAASRTEAAAKAISLGLVQL